MSLVSLGIKTAFSRWRGLRLSEELLDKFLFLWTGDFEGDNLANDLGDDVITVTGKDFDTNYIPATSSATFSFAEEAKCSDKSTVVKVLTSEMKKASPKICKKLALPAHEEIAYIKRIIFTEGIPLFSDQTYILSSIGRSVLRADLEKEPIYSVIEQLGYRITEGWQRINAVALTPNQARLLKTKPYSPSLLICRTTYHDPDHPIEYSEALYRNDRYQYQTRLKRKIPE